jgi:hypothetical protein
MYSQKKFGYHLPLLQMFERTPKLGKPEMNLRKPTINHRLRYVLIEEISLPAHPVPLNKTPAAVTHFLWFGGGAKPGQERDIF